MSKLLRPAVTAGLLAVLAARIDWGPFAASFRGVRPGWLAAGLGLYLLLQALSGWRWWLLAGAFGFPRPLRRLTAVYFLGMYCNLLLPTSVGGDVVRAWYLDAGQGRRMAALLCVLVDRLLGLLVLLALACAAAALAVRDLPAWVAAGVWCLSAGVFAGLLAAPWLSRVTGRLLERRSGPGFRPGRAARLLYLLRRTATVPAGVVGGLLGLRRQPGVLAWALAGSLVIQAGNVAVVWAAARALNADVPVLALAVAVPVVSFLTLLPVSVNGMGVREAGMGVILAAAGAPAGVGVSVAVLWFGLIVACSLPGLGVYLAGRFPAPPAGGAGGTAFADTEGGADGLAVDRDPGQGRAG